MSPCLFWATVGSKWFDESRVDEEDNLARNNGTWVHAALDQLVKEPASRDYARRWPNKDCLVLYSNAAAYLEETVRPLCRQLWSEVAVGVNFSTGEYTNFWNVKNREYPKLPGWQFGTADLVGITWDDKLYVGDWKTGGTEGAKEQLLSLSGCLQKAFQFQEGYPPMPVMTACLQVNGEAVWPHVQDVPQETLDAHMDKLKGVIDELNGGDNAPVPGIHCTQLYCPALGHCPAIEGIVRDLASNAGEGTGPVSMPNDIYSGDIPSSDKAAGEAMAMVSAAKRQAKYVEAGLKKYIKDGGRVTLDGWTWSEGNNGFRWRKD